MKHFSVVKRISSLVFCFSFSICAFGEKDPPTEAVLSSYHRDSLQRILDESRQIINEVNAPRLKIIEALSELYGISSLHHCDFWSGPLKLDANDKRPVKEIKEMAYLNFSILGKSQPFKIQIATRLRKNEGDGADSNSPPQSIFDLNYASANSAFENEVVNEITGMFKNNKISFNPVTNRRPASPEAVQRWPMTEETVQAMEKDTCARVALLAAMKEVRDQFKENCEEPPLELKINSLTPLKASRLYKVEFEGGRTLEIKTVKGKDKSESCEPQF
ncbi:MAG: hypothetical protein C5B49_09855 [Bdellovibrio sp.]|nr:MAG: hypothetical protein C5B49_09855 [Bdellovibrio sp.]